MVAIESSASPHDTKPKPDLCPCGHPAQRHYVDTPYGKPSRTVCYDCPPGRCATLSAGGAR